MRKSYPDKAEERQGPSLDENRKQVANSKEYGEGRDTFELEYMYEISGDYERITQKRKTLKTRVIAVLIWIFGFLTGLLCNYVAAFLVDKFKLWQ